MLLLACHSDQSCMMAIPGNSRRDEGITKHHLSCSLRGFYSKLEFHTGFFGGGGENGATLPQESF